MSMVTGCGDAVAPSFHDTAWRCGLALWTQRLTLGLIGFSVLAFAVNRFQKCIG